MKVPTPLLRLVLLAAVATSTSARTTTLQPFQCPSTLLLPPLTDLSRTCLPLVDDTTPSHEPWAYPPRCAEPVPGSKKQLAKYCVYTYIAPDPNGDRGGRGGGNGNGGAPKVGGGGGISVATTPYVAAEAAGIIAHFAPRWASEGSSFHLDPAGIAHPQPGTGRSQPQPAVEVRPIPGKGLGVVALRDIAENEIIFREAPYLVDISQQLDLRDPREEGLILQRSVSQLPARDRDRVWDMARSLGSSDILGDIMRTNVFGIVVAGVDHSGLYPAISRINHACKPNCFTRYDPHTMRMDVLAYNDIKKGEELSISYTALNLRSQDRRELLSRWGFNCTCPLCHSARASSLSDRNRNRIQDILDVLHEEPNRDPPEYVELLSEEVFSLVYEEGLKAQSGEFDAVMSHVWLEMSGDRDRSGARGGKDDSRAGSAQGQSKAGKQSGGGQSGGGLVDKFSASNRGGKGGRWNGRGIGEEERQRRRQKSREHAARAVKVRGWYSGEESEFTERARRFLEKNFGEV